MLTQRSKDMERLMAALELCRKLHAGQTDKCGQPYWIHPFTVAMRGFTGYANDRPISYAIVGTQLMELTDKEIDALKLLTRQEGVSYNEYINSIIESGNEIAINVKIDDLLHNMNFDRFTEADVKITDQDIKRGKKYAKAFDKLLNGLNASE